MVYQVQYRHNPFEVVKMNLTPIALSILISACAIAPAFAGSAPAAPAAAVVAPAVVVSSPATDAEAKSARVGFEKNTKAKSTSSAATPIPGLYEIIVDGQAVYTDKTGRFLIQGNIIDTEASKNITEERLSMINRVDIKTLPLGDAMKVVHGTGARTLVAFEDANCGYCKKLAPELEKLQNVTIYIFPVGILGPDSLIKAQAIVCAQQPIKLWDDAMANRLGNYSVDASCKAASSIERNTKLFAAIGLRGTPGILFADGGRLPGYAAAETIEARLAATK